MRVGNRETEVEWAFAKVLLEYKTWKKNSPFLYDMILRYDTAALEQYSKANDCSTALEWPTLTTQWFPDVKE